MSAAPGQGRPDLIRHLRSSPEAYEFLQALRLLRRAHARGRRPGGEVFPPHDDAGADGDDRGEGGSRRGGDASPPLESRIAVSPSLGYPASELARPPASNVRGAGEAGLWLNFFGLHGPTGVLPAFVTQAVASAGSGSALARVLDFFNHELAAAYAKAAAATRVDLTFEAARLRWADSGGRDGDDEITRLLLGLAGERAGGRAAEAGPGRGPRTRAQDVAVARFFAAAWRQRPMPVTSLRSILEALLRLPVQVLPFEPVWIEVEPASRLGLRPPPYANGRVLGRRTRSVQWGVRVRIGPLDYATFRRLLPGQRLLRRVSQLLEAALGPWTDFVVQPVLRQDEVPNWCLGRDSRTDAGALARQPRLGRSLFLRGERPRAYPRDFDQLKIRSDAVRRKPARVGGAATGEDGGRPAARAAPRPEPSQTAVGARTEIAGEDGQERTDP